MKTLSGVHQLVNIVSIGSMPSEMFAVVSNLHYFSSSRCSVTPALMVSRRKCWDNKWD